MGCAASDIRAELFTAAAAGDAERFDDYWGVAKQEPDWEILGENEVALVARIRSGGSAGGVEPAASGLPERKPLNHPTAARIRHGNPRRPRSKLIFQ